MLSANETGLIQKISTYIRYLSLMAIERAKSGHPGMPLGMAEAGALLYLKHLNSATDREWINRDRFVLSAGHGSMLLYSLEYIFKNSLTINDIASFRRLGSKTPGHPELDLHAGVETSTGPLGQGFANAVGIALQGKMLSEKFGNSASPLFDYTTYAVIGDGCNMEGIAYEAASLAGHWKLDNLIAIFDSNSITIDGTTDISFSENVAKRYQAMGWYVTEASSDSIESLEHAINQAKTIQNQPKLIIYTSIIGNGLNRICASSKCHGAPAGIDEIAYFVEHSQMKDFFKAKYKAETTEKIREVISSQLKSGDFITKEEFIGKLEDNSAAKFTAWQENYIKYTKTNPSSGIESIKLLDISKIKEKIFSFRDKPRASREIFSALIQHIEKDFEKLICSSADLASSTKVKIDSSSFVSANGYNRRNIAFGIREHAMGAVMNGLAIDGIFIPATSTFQVFSDYMRPAIRMAALMKLRNLFVFTHDSYMVGEDGPTHQPVEHINSLRIIPGLKVFRPANDTETAFSLMHFLENQTPAALILSRQALDARVFSQDERNEEAYRNFKRGAYVFKKFNEGKDCTIYASGHEVSLAIKAGEILEKKGINAEIVSIPSLELLEECGSDYINETVFRKNTKKFFIEPFCFKSLRVLFNPDIEFISIDHFGASGHPDELAEHFGFTPEKVSAVIESKL